MMLARVADSLYWMGRYIERAEHVSRLSDVMLTASLDATGDAPRAARPALGAPEDVDEGKTAVDVALSLILDRDDPGSVIVSVARARENARQVRDQITSETWERLNLLFLRITSPDAKRQFDQRAVTFLHEVISDLHLFKGAVDSTMSHGEG
ncbi:MAG: alpha-E domain-containing protein, partial [Caulobacteraceae bacterium]|nr:alpha-E domain-containing protein [Caulobacteraceae bacterium]